MYEGVLICGERESASLYTINGCCQDITIMCFHKINITIPTATTPVEVGMTDLARDGEASWLAAEEDCIELRLLISMTRANLVPRIHS
jgi:hypothetical protein